MNNKTKEIDEQRIKECYVLGKLTVQSIVGLAVMGVVSKTLEAVLIASTCDEHIGIGSKIGIFAIAALVGIKCSDMSEETYYKVSIALLKFKAFMNEIDNRESITNEEIFELLKKYLKEELGLNT